MRAVSFRHAGAAAVLVLLLYPLAGAAQDVSDIRDELRKSAAELDLSETVQGLAGFVAFPGVSAANFTVDTDLENASDTEVTKIVLPLAGDFAEIGVLDASLYGEVTFGYVRIDQDLDDIEEGTALESSVRSRIEAYSGIVGLGLTIPLGYGTVIRPIALAGYSHTDQDSSFSGPGASELARVSDGILFNVDVNQALFGGAVALANQTSLPHDLGFNGEIRYNHMISEGFAASDGIYETRTDFGVMTSLAELDGPTGRDVLGFKARWLASLAASYFPGTSSDALGFDYFVEAGGGMAFLHPTTLHGIEGVELRGSIVLGNGVSGWSASLALRF